MPYVNEKVSLAKLVYFYILQYPGCTTRQMETYFREHNFGFKSSYTSQEIASIIKTYNSENHNNWFNVDIVQHSKVVRKYYPKGFKVVEK